MQFLCSTPRIPSSRPSGAPSYATKAAARSGAQSVAPTAILNWVSQIWPFAHVMKKGDLLVLPLKTQPAIQIGEVTGDYHFEPGGPDPFFHWRPVKWIGEAIPRVHFGKDLLYTFGAFMTICRVQRNNAEARITAMYANGWKPEAMDAGCTRNQIEEATDPRPRRLRERPPPPQGRPSGATGASARGGRDDTVSPPPAHPSGDHGAPAASCISVKPADHRCGHAEPVRDASSLASPPPRTCRGSPAPIAECHRSACHNSSST